MIITLSNKTLEHLGATSLTVAYLFRFIASESTFTTQNDRECRLYKFK